MAAKNPFLIFMGVEEKTAKIEALGGATIKYRELTLAESDNFTKRIIKKYSTDTKDAEIDYDAASEIKYEKVATVLIEPKMTVEELKSMHGAKAGEAITEILKLIEPDNDEGDDEKGNDS